MSKYIDILDRLERSSPPPAASALQDAVPAAAHPASRPPDRRPPPLHVGLRAALEQPATETTRDAAAPGPSPWTRASDEARSDAAGQVLARLEAATAGRHPAVLVLAGASAAAPAWDVAQRLATQASLVGRPSLVAAVVDRGPGPETDPARHPTLTVDEARTRDSLRRWLDERAPEAAMVLLVTCPLDERPDAAVVSTACDGLVLVVASGRTPRASLTLAAHRAALCDAPVLGAVVTSAGPALPRWAHRLLGG